MYGAYSLRHQIIPSAFIIAGVMGGVKKKRGLTQNFAAGRTFPILPAAFCISKLVRNHRLCFRPALFHRLLVAHGIGADRRYQPVNEKVSSKYINIIKKIKAAQ